MSNSAGSQKLGNAKDQTKVPLQPFPVMGVHFQQVAVNILDPFLLLWVLDTVTS